MSNVVCTSNFTLILQMYTLMKKEKYANKRILYNLQNSIICKSFRQNLCGFRRVDCTKEILSYYGQKELKTPSQIKIAFNKILALKRRFLQECVTRPISLLEILKLGLLGSQGWKLLTNRTSSNWVNMCFAIFRNSDAFEVFRGFYIF